VSRLPLGAAWARAERVVGRRIGAAYVLVRLAGRDADLDSILNLNRVAVFIWEHLDGARTGEAIVQAVVERFDVERARAEVDTLELLGTRHPRPLRPSLTGLRAGG